MGKELKTDLINELEILYNTQLMNEFPSEDIEQIEIDFEGVIPEIEWLTADFNEFCMLIAGSTSYVLGNKKTPPYQRQFLNKNFFSLYPKYTSLKVSTSNYPQFNKELESFEKARELLLVIIANGR